MSNEVENGIRYESKTTAPCESKLEFTASAAAVDAAFKTALREAAKYARIPGFRPGKAPASMVKSRYKDYILEDVERNLQSAGFEKIASADRKELDAVAYGRFNAEAKPAEGADYKFSLEVELAPAVDVPDFHAFGITKPESDPVEKIVADRLAYFRSLYADYKPVEDAAVEGDMLKVSYESDFALPENAPASLARAVKSDESWLRLAEPEQIPGMNKALIGAAKGAEVSFAAVFPEDWHQEELRGKTVNYKMKINDGQRKVEITDDEALAKKTGAKDAAQMMEQIRRSAETERENDIRAKAREAMLAALLEKTPVFDMPAGMISSVTQREFSRIAGRLVRSEQDLEAFKKDQEKHLEDAKKAAQDYLRKFFILRTVARNNGIEVTNEEIDGQIRLMCMYTGSKEADVRKRIAQNGGESEISEDLLMTKTLDFMVADICK